MYNLRSLFNMRRFVGCENPRQQFGPFAKDSEPPLSLRCEETPSGGVQLVLHDGDTRLPVPAYPLPAHVQERCAFWNRWVSHALETEWEHPISPYGPEAYAAAIAIGIATAYPNRAVDWCGLPVHDDYAILMHLESLSRRRKDSRSFPILPESTPQNNYTRNLLLQLGACSPTFRGLKEHFVDYYDQGIMFCEYTYKIPPHYPDDTSLYCPEWLEEEIDRCGMTYGYDISYELYGWTRCKLLHGFRADAVGIDLLRYHPYHEPVCSYTAYIARPEDFPPFE